MKKSLDISYKRIFGRNDGLFSHDEIRRVKQLRIGIVGLGALGGAVGVMMARLGFTKFKLIDPEKHDSTNINRQFTAFLDTIGEYKVIAAKKEIKRINPFAEIETIVGSIGKKTVEAFTSDVDVIVDGIDFFKIDQQNILHSCAKKNNIWVHTAQAAGSLFTLVNFNPQKAPISELIHPYNLRSVIKYYFPILPKEATPELLNEIINENRIHISSYALPSPVGAAFLCNEIIKKHVELNEVEFSPNIMVVDIGRLEIKVLKRK